MFVSFWLSKADIGQLVTGKSLWITSYAMTESFLESFAVAADSEEAEYTLTWLAGVFGLRKISETGEPGLIAIAQLKNDAANWCESNDFGAISVEISQADITALFTIDSPAAQIPKDLEWGSDAVFEFISKTDLLWYDITELAFLSNQL